VLLKICTDGEVVKHTPLEVTNIYDAGDIVERPELSYVFRGQFITLMLAGFRWGYQLEVVTVGAEPQRN
jgi:hypothetical protein